MPLSSKAPDAKGALLTHFRADATLSKLQITNGFVKNPEREWLYLGEITWETDEDAVLKATGSGRRQEVFNVQVAISVQLPGNDAQAAEDRCTELAGVVEDVIRSNERLDGLVLQMELVPTQVRTFPYTDGYESEFQGQVRFTARK